MVTTPGSPPVDSNLKQSATTSILPKRPENASLRGRKSSHNIRYQHHDEDDRQPSDLAELLMAHRQYRHISMKKIEEMARQGILPKRLAKCRIPTCSACLYSKATKRPWRGKESKKGGGKKLPRHPGHLLSADQLVSPSTPGLIAQMTGFLTTKRYNYATIYVDQQYSRFGFIYLQKTASAEETVEGKRAFEAMAKREGV